MELGERFWSKVEKTGDCWLWTAYKNRKGYGQFRVSGDLVLGAHRVAYELAVGPIPEGLVIDHLCRNRGCVNPAHMEPVTALENTRRGDPGGFQRSKTHCPKGHEYAGWNLKVAGGKRQCRTCHNQNLREWRARQRA